MSFIADEALFDYAVGMACETFAPFIRDAVEKQRCIELARMHQERAHQKNRAAEAEARLIAEMGVVDDDN